MTRNQLEYWKNQETERHNKALESQGLIGLSLQREANAITQSAATETARSNRARELENYRSNLAKEAAEVLRINELIRSNQANEAINQMNAATNRMNAYVNQQNANTNARNAATNEMNANTQYSSTLETIRHNMASEAISRDHNPWTTLAGVTRDIINKITNNDTAAWVQGVKDTVASNISQVTTSIKNVTNQVIPTKAPYVTPKAVTQTKGYVSGPTNKTAAVDALWKRFS